MKEYGRDLRIADFVRDELALVIQQNMRDPRVGMVSINDVKVSKDLSYADIYVSCFDAGDQEQKDELVTVLNKAAGFFRSQLAKRHSMRTTPKPRFHYDKLVESGPRLEALIQKAVSSDEKNSNQDNSNQDNSDQKNSGAEGRE